MKVIKTLSIINFFIFLAFNIKNESKYSNTLINNAYNMSIRRSMTDTGAGDGTSGTGSDAGTSGTGSGAGTSGTGSGAGTSASGVGTSASGVGTSASGVGTSGAGVGTSGAGTPASATGSTSNVTTTDSKSPSTDTTSTESSSSDDASNNTGDHVQEDEKQNELNKVTSQGPQAAQEPQTADTTNPTPQEPQTEDTTNPTSQPEQAKNPTPATEQAETPELQSVPENKATEKHGHMHGSRNNHPQNTSESQKECTDGDQTNCGAQTSLLSNSSNIASINKFVALISATLVLAFAIFI
ncbi:merozoite surface protein 2 [Plasmodium reichenowi]|uniref:Merozoite surface antigen 2 n=1 Tax=Plasmodium reichenowi TaxID=5854 RepID=A0A060RS55_PLARE|nr:merozoite surface protein 2 [Plasmodium reichenowi]